MAAFAPASLRDPSLSHAAARIDSLALPDTVWRGNQMGAYRAQPQASGFAALDRELPGGGWPPSSLVELLLPQAGVGEWRLLAPALSRLTQSGKPLILLAPPHRPYAAALQALGIDIRQILLVEADKAADRVWAAEQALKSAGFGALLCWFPQIRSEHVRRLQLASAGCEGLTFLLRPLAAQEQSSSAPLRLACRATQSGGLSIDIVKRRGPAHARPLILPLPVPRTLLRPLAARSAQPELDAISHAVARPSSAAITGRRRTPLPV